MKNLNIIVILSLIVIAASCNSNYKVVENTPKLKYDIAQPQIRHYPKNDLKQAYKHADESAFQEHLSVDNNEIKQIKSTGTVQNREIESVPFADETIELDEFIESINHESIQQTEAVGKMSSKNKGLLTGLAGLMGLFTLALGIPLIKKTKSLSLWASRNKKQSQTFLTLSHIGLGASGFFLGNQLADAGILTSELSSQLLFGAAGIATALYPVRKKKSGFLKYSFLKAKMFSLFLAFTGFALMMNVGNNWAENKHNAESPVEVVSSLEAPEHNNTVVIDNDEPERVVLRILGTIGVVLLSIILLYIVAIFSCALACSNMGALAVVVLLGGLAGTIFLAIFLLKSIWKRKPKKDLGFSA
jgi:hypothetical protein